MSSGLNLSFASLLQHAGAEHRLGRGLVGALEQSVTFETPQIDDLPCYSRLSNTVNHAEVCEVVAALHAAESALVFSSGMAAIFSVLASILKPGDHILLQENCYGSTQGLCQKVFSRWGIESSFVPLHKWQEALRINTRVLFFESISNPYCIPQDIVKAREAKNKSGAILVCDNTFASPVNCRPLKHGVDVVVESATKYMNGHSDLVCGAVACSREMAETIASNTMYFGGFLATSGCMQLLKGLRTLHARMKIHNENGRTAAAALRSLPGVSEVYHGSLLQSQDDWITDYAGMLTIRFDKKIDVVRLLQNLKLVANVPSLGGTETTACMPWWTTNRWMPDSEKSALGIDEQLLRLSLGLENIDDILQDFRHALALEQEFLTESFS